MNGLDAVAPEAERYLCEYIGAAADAACEAGKGGLLPWQQLQAWLPIQGPPREEAVRTAVHDILVHLHGTAWSFLRELVFLNFQREDEDRSDLSF